MRPSNVVVDLIGLECRREGLAHRGEARQVAAAAGQAARPLVGYPGVMMRDALAVVAGLCPLIPGAPAQQTWVVDPGGGGNFTQLTQAVAAANSGDTIVLRGGGTHLGVYLDKALSFVGELPRSRIGSLHTPVNTVSPFVSVSGVNVGFCRLIGRAAFENVAFDGGLQLWGGEFSFHRCQVSTLGAAQRPAMEISNCHVVITASSVAGGAPGTFTTGWGCHHVAGGPGILMGPGSVTIADSVVTGGAGLSIPQCGFPVGPLPAMQLTGGITRVTGSVLQSGQPVSSFQPPPVSGGQFEFDASTQFVPANNVGVMTFLPGTGGQGTPPGGVMNCRVETAPLLPAALVASLGFRSPTAVNEGIAWIDLSAFVVLVIGFTDPSGHLNASIAIPPSAPRGLAITVQSVAAPSATGALTAGAPAVLLVQ